MQSNMYVSHCAKKRKRANLFWLSVLPHANFGNIKYFKTENILKKCHNQGLEEQIAHFRFSQYGPKQAWLLMRNIKYVPSFCRVIKKTSGSCGEREN